MPQRRDYAATVPQRRQTLDIFRERLAEVLVRSGLTRSDFAAAAGLDRSTLSQLMSPTNRRLPRVETLTEIAATQQVSIDWLLGLTHAGPMQAEMLREETSFADAPSPNDERLLGWFDEARGYKVRHVPSTLPDVLKTEAVIHHELGEHVAISPEQMIGTVAARLAWTRDAGGDLECCNSVQAVESFARGEGIFRTLPAAERAAQLEHMLALVDELYPRLRWFLFDGLHRYAAPITIFGPQRAALYVGQMYLVLSSREHVRTLTRHFDDLVRGAVVQPNEITGFLDDQLRVARRSRR